ncbi:hypothetical protein L484_019807 [Morus notabilis]|uniref:Uncharacterized protein n=1 Tax=Morus notabilis TaxID=981085 RepID=W9SI83_9ROSA|nr:hypothetical protein L484_019807 [Morus notabilis]
MPLMDHIRGRVTVVIEGVSMETFEICETQNPANSSTISGNSRPPPTQNTTQSLSDEFDGQDPLAVQCGAQATDSDGGGWWSFMIGCAAATGIAGEIGSNSGEGEEDNLR